MAYTQAQIEGRDGCTITAVVLHEYNRGIEQLNADVIECDPKSTPKCRASYHVGIGSTGVETYVDAINQAITYSEDELQQCQPCDDVLAVAPDPEKPANAYTYNIAVTGGVNSSDFCDVAQLKCTAEHVAEVLLANDLTVEALFRHCEDLCNVDWDLFLACVTAAMEGVDVDADDDCPECADVVCVETDAEGNPTAIIVGDTTIVIGEVTGEGLSKADVEACIEAALSTDDPAGAIKAAIIACIEAELVADTGIIWQAIKDCIPTVEQTDPDENGVITTTITINGVPTTIAHCPTCATGTGGGSVVTTDQTLPDENGVITTTITVDGVNTVITHCPTCGGSGDDTVTTIIPEGVDDPNDPAGDGSEPALADNGPLLQCDADGNLTGIWIADTAGVWTLKPILGGPSVSMTFISTDPAFDPNAAPAVDKALFDTVAIINPDSLGDGSNVPCVESVYYCDGTDWVEKCDCRSGNCTVLWDSAGGATAPTGIPVDPTCPEIAVDTETGAVSHYWNGTAWVPISSGGGGAGASLVRRTADGCFLEHVDDNGAVTDTWVARDEDQAFSANISSGPFLFSVANGDIPANGDVIAINTYTFTNWSTCRAARLYIGYRSGNVRSILSPGDWWLMSNSNNPGLNPAFYFDNRGITSTRALEPSTNLENWSTAVGASGVLNMSQESVFTNGSIVGGNSSIRIAGYTMHFIAVLE